MNGTLAPKSLEAILKETFSIYKSNFLRLIAIVAIVQVPVAILAAVANLLMPIYGELGTEAVSPLMYLFWIPIYLALFAASILMGGAVIHAVSEQYFNQPVNISRAYSFAWQRMGDMFWAVILAYLAIFGIFLAAILISVILSVAVGGTYGWLIAFAIAVTLIFIVAPAAIYLGINWAFILPTALLEGCGPTAAMSHSAALVKQNWWRVMGIMLLLLTIVSLIAMIFYMPAMIGTTTWAISGAMTGAETELPTGIMVWAIIGGAIGGIISAPIGIIGITLLYFDLRVRKQGYSLDALADELGLRSAPTDAIA